MEARLSTSCSSSLGPNSKPCNKATELACNACVLCVSCPLAIVSCFIKLPCMIGWRMAHHVGHRVCCGSEKRILAAYSSFSDTDSDNLPSEVQGRTTCLGALKSRMTHKCNGCAGRQKSNKKGPLRSCCTVCLNETVRKSRGERLRGFSSSNT